MRLCGRPGWFLLMLVAATLLVASVVAPPLFVATARATALADGLQAAADERYGPDSGDLRVSWDAVLPADSEAQLMERIEALTGWGTPALGAAGVAQSHTRKSVAIADGRTEPSVLWYHDGAIEAIGGDADADGRLAGRPTSPQRLGLEVGDQFRLGLEQTFLADAGTSGPDRARRDLRDRAATRRSRPRSSTCPDVDRWYLPPDPDDPIRPAPRWRSPAAPPSTG